jgi:hypothetical protein
VRIRIAGQEQIDGKEIAGPEAETAALPERATGIAGKAIGARTTAESSQRKSPPG